MSLLRRKGLFESTKVLFLPIAAISPNPDQPRTCFSREGLEELAASIQELGVLQPLSVRRSKNGGYELISGERRLRASRMAGLTEVPCILVSVDSQGSSLLALVENLQRRDLNFVEEATALAKLIETYHLSQEEAARRIGKSQSAVANKLRLLRLPPDVLTLLRERGCTERHARALLRLEEPELQRTAARHVAEQGLTVARTEEYVETLLHPADKPARKKPTFVIKDVRLFLNTVTRGLSMMKSAGVQANCVDKTTSPNIYDVLLNGTETAKAISSTSYGDVLPSNKALAGATIEMIALEQREYRLKNALEQVAEHYDYIFIDCPPSLELLTLNALCAADTVLVPVQCEYYALEGLSDLLSTIRIVKRSLNPKIALEGVVLTMYDGRTNLSMQVAEEVKRHFPGQVYATVIPRNVRLSEAPSFGKPVSAYDALSRGAEAYDALAQELLEHNQYAVTRVERKD